MARVAPGIGLVPNAVTVLALCAGLSSVMFALDGRFAAAVAAVATAALLDGLDGRLARLLDATSRMGAELDSLADAVSFGVAPALVVFIWSLHGSQWGWVVCLLFAVCAVLRLARFNVLMEDTKSPPFGKEFFVGVPAPAGALTALFPLVISLKSGEGWWSSQLVVALWVIAIGGLLISRVPTLSFKTLKVPAKAIAPLLMLVGLLAAAVITYPLLVLATFIVLYLAHVPFAVRRYRWLSRHPEAWDVPAGERRAIRRSTSRLRLRRPRLRPRVAGDAVRAESGGSGPVGARRSWRRLGLRRRS
ncbi:CDP-diacylglycerol--serine O-phosphatidyltransferase [Actinoalloteichus sp. AHMU CJ021]|uniref:CDP-diacylglycerol--serine O-phosphatidyltransferase n=1 Tax=Actinoalloteichus caeruleus DSM 43889 TaxID=1120930 RepID=A0ABT1JK89_ACTCY|nr:CDP-diacylglycerol--serine O-phosphatidyltransferase [Actinoalloteichus caeruleus]AUS78491.1 CDP-diacylglycerol--serine O-phosphatidyltransferase [Actinoalloteichus sp. AHMU CJ021]MCP2332593.1 CDP-diacylglycerol---serine O-phosphatidyltransferase [Actinoalloteichus caeruleus DSM 43889]